MSKKVDLRTLPVWLQYTVSLTIIVVVVAAAWFVGRNQPVPVWITTYLVPILGWAYLILFIYAVASRIFQNPSS